MAKGNFISSIDVGTHKVCSIIANMGSEGNLRILGVGVVPSQGMRKGVVVNIDEARVAIRESVRNAELASGLKIESAFIGVTGRHVASLNTRSAVAISRGDRVVHTGDLRRAMVGVRTLKITPERALLHVIPRGYALDGQEGVKNPVGMHGFRLDADTHVITASTTSVQNLVKAIRAVGVEAEDLVLNPLAAAEAILLPDERDAGVALVDIGAGTTAVCVFKAGSVWSTSVIPAGGYQISRDIAIGLGIPFELAEQIKVKYGNLKPTPNGKGKEGPDNRVVNVGNGHDILLHDLNDIIHSRVDELLRLALAEIPDADYLSSTLPAGIVLTGGTANLPGIDVVASEVFSSAVRIGIPRDVYGLADQLSDPAHATSVGLLLWGARRQVGEWRASHQGLGHRLTAPYRMARRVWHRSFESE